MGKVKRRKFQVRVTLIWFKAVCVYSLGFTVMLTRVRAEARPHREVDGTHPQTC